MVFLNGTGLLAPAENSGGTYKVPTGAGQKISIKIENIGKTNINGTDTYADIPRISQEDVPKGSGYVSGTAMNPAWPTLVKRDVGWYEVTEGTKSTADGNHWFGTKSKGSNGRTQWDFELTLAKDFTSTGDGSGAVTFDLFWPFRRNTLPVQRPAVNAQVQYRVTVTSPWGVTTYTTGAV